MLTMASLKMPAMSPMSSAREPVGGSPQVPASFFACFALVFGWISHAAQRNQPAIRSFDENIDPLVENLCAL